jgi:hypothetical protein
VLLVFTFTAQFGTDREKQKTYGRFSGLIFSREAESALVNERQRLAALKVAKTGQTAKKSVK